MTTPTGPAASSAPPPATEGHAPAHASTSIAEGVKNKHWTDHAARTTAVLAVLAAVSSGSYSGQFSKTILKQAEESDAWNYFQANSLKRHVSESALDSLRLLASTQAAPPPGFSEQEAKLSAAIAKYKEGAAKLQEDAKRIQTEKEKHGRQGDRFQLAFVVLQAGVVLSTIASSARRRELWVFALLAGIAGVLMVVNGFLLIL